MEGGSTEAEMWGKLVRMYKTTPDISSLYLDSEAILAVARQMASARFMILWIMQRRMNLDKDSEEMTFIGRGRAPANEERNTKPG